jgi:3-oxoacyl-[acyl-carrier protein] reductase
MKPRALITGGSRGIGAAIAEALAEAGHPIILNYRSNQAAAEAVKAKIVAAGGEVELCPFDVTKEAETRGAIAKLLDDPRPIGVLVNNAGITHDGAFPTLEPEAWDSVMKTSLWGFYNVTQPLVMPMVSRRFGRIINLTSVSGLIGNRGQVNYSAAKAGLIGATKALAQEVAKRGVTVNAVAPGLIETDMIRDVPTDQVLPHIPMRRLGQPREVADLVAFLASEKAGYITAQVIGISGGLA